MPLGLDCATAIVVGWIWGGVGNALMLWTKLAMSEKDSTALLPAATSDRPDIACCLRAAAPAAALSAIVGIPPSAEKGVLPEGGAEGVGTALVGTVVFPYAALAPAISPLGFAGRSKRVTMALIAASPFSPLANDMESSAHRIPALPSAKLR